MNTQKHDYFVTNITDSPLPQSSVLGTSPLEMKDQSLFCQEVP